MPLILNRKVFFGYLLCLPLAAVAQFQPIGGNLQQVSVGADGAVWGINSAGSIYTYNFATRNWQNIPGTLSQIAVGASGYVWGLNPSGQIYRYDFAAQAWDFIPGSLSQLAVGSDGDVWGINAGSSIFHFDRASQSWQNIPGLLASIAVGFDAAVWGINSAGNVYRLNIGTMLFEQVPGMLSQISVGGDGDVWGLSGNSVFHFNSLRQAWEPLPGNFSQLSVGSASSVWGLDFSGSVFQFSNQSQNWAQVAGSLTRLSAGSNGGVWAVDAAGNIYQDPGVQPAALAWRPIPGNLAQLAIGADNNMWGLDAGQHIWHFNPLVQSWELVPGALSRIAVGFGGNVWGLDSSGLIYRYASAAGSWNAIAGQLSQISVAANGAVWGINAGGSIYRYNESTQGWDWIPGVLQQLSVGADGDVWGINAAGQIWRYDPQTGGWQQIPGVLAQISVGSSNAVWGLDATGNIYQFDPQAQNWNPITGNLSQIGVAFDGTVLGVNSANQAFRYNAGAAVWNFAGGSFGQIAVAADNAVAALGPSGSIFQQPAAPLAVTAVSNDSPIPLTPIYLQTLGLNASAPVTVSFSDQLGFNVVQPALRVQPDGTVVAGVPIYFDPSLNDSRPATINVTVIQGALSSQPVAIDVQDLPRVAGYGMQLGAISHSFLNYAALTMAHRVNEFQALNSFPGNQADASPVIGNLSTLLSSVIRARSDVDNVSNNNSLVISAGTLADGTPLQFDQHSLDMMDRIIGMYLTQLGPYLTNLPPAAGVSVNGHSKVPFANSGSLPSLLGFLTTSANTTGLASTYQSWATSDNTFLDKALAAGGALAGLLGYAKQVAPDNPFIQTPLGMASAGLGALVGLGSMLNDFAQELGAGVFVLLNSGSNVDPQVYQEALQKAADANLHLAIDSAQTFLSLFDYGVSSGSFEGSLAAQFDLQAAQSIQNQLESIAGSPLQAAYLVTNIANFAASHGFDSETSTVTEWADTQSVPFGSDSQGFTQLQGTVDVSNSLGQDAALSGAEVTSDSSDSFSTVADPNGDYNLWVPLQDPNFDYSNSQFQVVDPETQSTINSESINLSGATSATPVTVPTLSGACGDDDASNPDSDDPDCDSTAAVRKSPPISGAAKPHFPRLSPPVTGHKQTDARP